jgi:hypothetical protein
MTDMERTRLAEADLRIAKCKAHPSLSKKHSADGSARPIYVTRGVAMEAILCAFERSASVLFLRRIRGEMCKRVAVLERIRR